MIEPQLTRIDASRLVDTETALSWLTRLVSPERLSHSLGTHDKAKELAEKFHFSPLEYEQAAIGSLLHDAAKLMPPADLFAYCRDHGLAISEDDLASPQTLHPFVGADRVERELGITDPEVLNAIRFHTTGRANMSSVEKVVYIADKIEGNTRNPLFTQKVTAHLEYGNRDSLDETMLYLLDSTLMFLIEKHQAIHPRTLEARNDFIARLRNTASHLPSKPSP